jgi:predicted TIM-barrel fold metal-dependent hydrolase
VRTLTALIVLTLAAPAWGQQRTHPVIDTHNHLHGRLSPRQGGFDFAGAAEVALGEMDRLGIRTLMIMPPPQPDNFAHGYDASRLFPIARRHPGRFAVLAGGGSLNVMIQRAVRTGDAGIEVRRRFQARALELVRQGAVGFGEFTAEHFSMTPRHPYVSAPPDHPLFKLLADIAAHHGLPIDLHMEALPEDMATPPGLLRRGRNPARVRANLAAFERLLAHNRKASIIWVHLGWDNSGRRNAVLTRALLERHANLYLSFRVPPKRRRGPPSFMANRISTLDDRLQPAWRALFVDHSQRILVGTDRFFVSPRIHSHLSNTADSDATLAVLDQLPATVARRIAFENAARLFRLPPN